MGTSTAHIDNFVGSTGSTGEFTDYFATQCQGVELTIAGAKLSAATVDAITSGATYTNELYSGYYLSDLTWAEIKLLKICMGDADGETSNNVEVYNWDYGSYYLVDGATVAMDSYPHALKLVPTNPTDNFDAGVYYLTWWDDTNDVFRLANAPGAGSTIGDAGKYDTTITYNEFTTTTNSDMVEPRVTARFAKWSNVLYPSYDSACQTAPGFVEPCLEKGDLLFIIDSNYLYDAYDAYESTTNALVSIEDNEYDTGMLYTIEKIYTADPTEDTFGWGAPGTFGEDRFRIVLDKNVNFAGLNTTHDFARGSMNATAVGIVNIFKFSPATTGNYQFVSQCSNRGACDTDAGNCECFKGYTGDDCTTQSSLAV